MRPSRELVPMSQRDLHRYHTLRLVLEHRLTGAEAAGAMRRPGSRSGSCWTGPGASTTMIASSPRSRPRRAPHSTASAVGATPPPRLRALRFSMNSYPERLTELQHTGLVGTELHLRRSASRHARFSRYRIGIADLLATLASPTPR
jgi:hypothetical protein